jgi:hypothetical protein
MVRAHSQADAGAIAGSTSSARATASATRWASLNRQPDIRMANSSPAMRATVSVARRTTERNRAATSRSSMSPIGCPSVALT